MNIEIANRLQKLRKENGYSQEELADKLGISRQAVSKWERAESSPDTDNLIILARLYNMSLDELLYDTESNEEIRNRNIDKEDSISLTDDEGQTLKIENGHIKCLDKNGDEVKLSSKRIIALSIIDGVISCLTLIGFLIWGFAFDGFYVAWTLWLFMIVVMSIFEAIFKKQITKFLYPVLMVATYCFIGMQFDIWHPTWILFVSIPLFYVIANPIDKYIFKTIKEDDEDTR